ncbi:Kinase [Hexamita inflata]|uniref:non-specific serine/threonine protein kinase n=1 Tax=Hexamita inflata TaxID=28002 RepID=A0AA86R6S6_9EUKA|nr:Kinase [Hexamita inflata]
MQFFDSLQFIEIISKGQNYETLLYRDKKTSINYVIKKIKIDNATDVTLEVNILKTLSHSNIVRYIESFIDDGYFYIVMDYADSGDLYQLISQRRHPFTETEVMYYFVQLLLALKHLHDRQILHRDIQTQKIFLNQINAADGAQRLQVKLGGFDKAKVTTPGQMEYEQVGTPYNLSPEIIREKGYNDKADIWSLGYVLYELCTLNPVFTGYSLYVIKTKIIMEKHSPIDSSKYSQDLSDIVNLMLSKDPEKRPSVNQLLALPIIRKWIPRFLSEKMISKEFGYLCEKVVKDNKEDKTL